ncbi:hypothetical protein AQI95_07090 [Streptomyces yokosukanensis]|uniref:SAF domain-containing protein n=1 Tax=Streptomyces yokosukanensis TaxID=67386 RepID=A0A117Q574_9ACTN|nr:hypothetical protein [Streptomyces yokosukanensis]KUN08769.1 hypothetical protein AQI95_07090 [Streptomyces yokosukanensis]
MKIQERTGAGAGRSAAPAQAPVGDRLPTPPRERKPALAALAVLLILLGALGATTLVLRAGNRIEVVKVTQPIQVGQSVNQDNSTSVMVADDSGIDYVRWDQLGALKGYKARTTIYPGTIVVGQMFTKGNVLPAGKAVVGVSLKEGQYPLDIQGGDTVAVYNVGGGSSGSSKTGTGTGASNGTGSSSGSSGDLITTAKVGDKKDGGDATVSTGNLSLSLIVDQSDAAAVARAASDQSIAVVHVSGSGN